ncbi:hypothetical protein ACOMHN_038941 [Nucella lapillus]
MEGDEALQKATANFTELCESDWKEYASSCALSTLEGRKYNKPHVLPLTDDLKKVTKHLEVERKKCLSELSWTGSPNFSKLVAAYDMILARHPAPLSLMRLATITSAYEGCNSFLSITHLANRLALPVEKALGYVLFRQSAMDLKNMLREGQEVEDPDSYFSHFRALGFSPKSPYSATAAPYFYNLVHLVGSYMGDTRSLNAVAMVDKAIHPIAIVSAYIGNYFMGTGEFGMFVGAEAIMDSKKNSRVRPTTAAARSPAQLLVFINAQGNKRLPAFKARYKAVVKSHGTPRPDTMADWINTSL